MLDADGIGRKQFQLPNDGYTRNLNSAISPDSKWLAYFTGSIEEPYNIALNLLNLSDETTQQISNLLAPDFPENLEPIVETMVLGDPPIYYVDCFEDLECRRSLVQNELTGYLSLDWSPDSQSIAFTAQIDGPSSDIYIYTLRDKTIRQLTNELQNIYSLDWAPNTKTILYEAISHPGVGSEGREYHLVNLEGKEISFSEELSQEFLHWDGYDWISENLYLLLRFSDAEPYHSDFKILNTDTGQIKEIWPHSAEYFAVDDENKAIHLYFRHYYDQNSLPAEGIYIVDINGNFRKISDWRLIIIKGQGPYQILGQDYERRVYNIRYDGSIETLKWNGYPFPYLSPNGKSLLYLEYKKIALYTDSYQPIKSWQTLCAYNCETLEANNLVSRAQEKSHDRGTDRQDRR
ncbi:MAG: hypothetical protein L0Z71_00470, partial [Anaerolineae bacterium]|nr:hypothetical protein [Anaerolineae bacterium]